MTEDLLLVFPVKLTSVSLGAIVIVEFFYYSAMMVITVNTNNLEHGNMMQIIIAV